MGSRINLKAVEVLTKKKILQDAKRAKKRALAGQTTKSKEIQEKLEAYVKYRAPKEKRRVFEYLLKRFRTEGDAFTALIGYGQYNELVTGILVGAYNTEEDILNYRVFDNIPGVQEGDLVYADKGRVIQGQVKGSGSEFHIPNGTFLDLDRDSNEATLSKVEGVVSEASKVKMLKSAAKNFASAIPSVGNFRVLTPIYRSQGTIGNFDMGLITFKKLMIENPDMFYFELKSEGKSLSIFKPAREWVKVVKKQIAVPVRQTAGGKNSPADQAMTQLVLDDILKIDSTLADEKIEQALYNLLYKARVAAWYKYGRIRFQFDDPKALAQGASPLIQTGIMREDNKKPFLELLIALYEQGYSRSLEEYLSDKQTLENKLPEYYYENTYAKPNY